MSQTFTLPITAADQFDHGHSQSGSRRQSKSHFRQSRLSPPFQLPRIPSGDASPLETTSDLQNAISKDSNYHNHQARHSNAISPYSQQEIVVKKRESHKMASHEHRNVSRVTARLLHASEKYALLHGIIADPESRRIFYFMLLNLAFMAVQFTYGYVTGSLGLISDSIHMFFDCVALVVGVSAAVMSKWPPSAKFPYGYGKIDTLAGLGNGIFLMLISVEIVYEAIERLFEGSHLQRTNELLVVSILGLAVNMVGIFAFHGHHSHHGHDHSHGGHSHRHESQVSHNKTPSTAASASPIKAAESGHGHHHGENMQGIYLHIMADALGSLAVVISTLLVQFSGWSGFDPLASCIIAVLIFVSTIPLVSSTTKILLLSLNSDVEYNLRDILGGISEIRGVVGYTVPKFWIEDMNKDDQEHDHDHDHSHSQKDSHSHSHHDHHDHPHSHSHSHQHDHMEHNHSSDSNPTIFGMIHIQISAYADLRDIQAKVTQHFHARKMEVVVQYEREGDTKCWCSGLGSTYMRTPQTGGMQTPVNGSFSSVFSAKGVNGHTKGSPGKASQLGKMI